jgi:hypothetical protein
LAKAEMFNCGGDASSPAIATKASQARLGHPKETKGQNYNVTTEAGQCCDGGNGGCC